MSHTLLLSSTDLLHQVPFGQQVSSMKLHLAFCFDRVIPDCVVIVVARSGKDPLYRFFPSITCNFDSTLTFFALLNLHIYVYLF